MAIQSGFFNSKNGDRKYFSTNFSSLFDGIITEGVFANIGTAFKVTHSSGFTFNVGSGKAWCLKTYLTNTSIHSVPIEPSDVLLPRIDAIVLDFNSTDSVRNNTIKYIKGVATSSPKKPVMKNVEGNKQLPICYITVPANAKVLSNSNIEYVVGKTACPFITGPLTTVKIDNFVASMQSQFDTWFDNLKSNLSGDVATKLQGQIGDLKTLKTKIKSSLTASINSLYDEFISYKEADQLQYFSMWQFKRSYHVAGRPIAMDERYYVGNGIGIEGDKIVIRKGVHHVRVDYAVGGGSDEYRIWARLYRNGTVVHDALSQGDVGNTYYGTYLSAVGSTVLVVKEGDTLWIDTNQNVTIADGGIGTYFTVQKLD